MIERLVTTLRALAALDATPDATRTEADVEELVGDFDDALFLARQCQSCELSVEQRAALGALESLLSRSPPMTARARVRELATTALRALGHASGAAS